MLVEAGTGTKTTDKGELHTYTTDDQSDYSSRMAMQSGPVTPASGRSVAAGDWNSGLGDSFGMTYVVLTEGFLNRLDDAVTDHQTTKTNDGTETVLVNLDDRTRDEHKLDRTDLDLDFSLSFGGSGDVGGIQVHQDQFTRTEHWNDSVYAHGVRTAHDYVEDYDAGHTLELSMGLTGADFDMDVYFTISSDEHRHTEGDLDSEVITGNRSAGSTMTAAFSLHDAGFGGFAFNMQSNAWLILNPYEIEHSPDRTGNGQRISTNQDYRTYYEVSGSTSTYDMSSATWPELSYGSSSNTQTVTFLGVRTGANPGHVVRDTTSSGTHTDRFGNTTSYSDTNNGVDQQLSDNYVLGLTDQHQPLPSMSGYNEAWNALASLQNLPGFSNFGTAWGNGMNAAGSGASGGSSSGSSTNINEGWTQATNPHTGETGQYWYEYHDHGTGPHDWHINWYSGNPANGGQLLWTEYGEGVTPTGAWGEGDGKAKTDTTPTPADEADNSTPPTATPTEHEFELPDTPATRAIKTRHELEAARNRYEDAVRRLRNARTANEYESALAERDKAEDALDEARKKHSDALKVADRWKDQNRTLIALQNSIHTQQVKLTGLEAEYEAIRQVLNDDPNLTPTQRAQLEGKKKFLHDVIIVCVR